MESSTTRGEHDADEEQHDTDGEQHDTRSSRIRGQDDTRGRTTWYIKQLRLGGGLPA